MTKLAIRLGLLAGVILFGTSGCTTLNKAKDIAKGYYSAVTNADQRKQYHSDKPVVLFILDTSGSMETEEKGQTRLDVARSSIIDSISQIDKAKYNTSLITFNKYVPCKADVAVAPGNNDPDVVVNKIKSISASGNTPLAEAIELSGTILNNVDKKLVILFSDGVETCDGNPARAAKTLALKHGIQLNLQVIGYAADRRTQLQLQQIANVGTNWGYHQADDPAALANVINLIATEAGVLDPIWEDIRTSTFEFAPGSTVLGDEYVEIIQKLYGYLKNNDKRITIIGHTDATGSSQGNMALSIQRANIVKNELVFLGISASRIATDGRGESEPVASNATEVGRKKNRRVVIRVLD